MAQQRRHSPQGSKKAQQRKMILRGRNMAQQRGNHPQGITKAQQGKMIFRVVIWRSKGETVHRSTRRHSKEE